jgi:hypothetical protein
MENRDLHCRIQASKAAPEVFAKICRVAQWWTVDVLGDPATVDDRFTVRFGKSHVTMDVVEMRPFSTIVWLVRDFYWSFYEDCSAWQGSSIRWEIIIAAHNVQLSMTHRGLRHGTACYDIFSEGWGLYVGNSLMGFINRDAGIPYKGPGGKVKNF